MENVVISTEKIIYADNVCTKKDKYLRDMYYKEYLNTEYWKVFSQRAKIHYGNKCLMCTKKAYDNGTVMHVHHKNKQAYNNRGKETFDDVILLCEKCHSMQHSLKN